MEKTNVYRATGAALGAFAVTVAGTGSAFAATGQQACEPEGVAGGAVAALTVGAQEWAAPSPRVVADRVTGTFTYTQTQTVCADDLMRAFGKGSFNICSNTLQEEDAAPLDATAVQEWQVRVTGDVSQEYVATMGEVAEKSQATRIMGCTCAGNPADGLASVNAEVTGVSISSLLEHAGVSGDANALTFVSADGYEATVPLWAVFTRPALLAYQAAGEPLFESLGVANQVWIGSASANCFVSDVVEIRAETLDAEPELPAFGENLPNASVGSAT